MIQGVVNARHEALAAVSRHAEGLHLATHAYSADAAASRLVTV